MNPYNIKLTFAAHGKYYAFRLAEELNKFGYLDKIYTLYPKFKLAYDLPPEKIKSFHFLGMVKYINMRYGSLALDDFITSFFDDRVAFVFEKNQSPNWIFASYSGFCEKSLKRAKELGAITLVERACPHIDEQEELISNEKSRLLKNNVPVESNKIHDRMKREYEIADYIVVPSEYSRKSFIKRGIDSTKLITIPICNEKNIILDKKSKSCDFFTVLCVGGNFYRKGIIYLLQAWKELGLGNANLIIRGSIPGAFRHLSSVSNVEVISRHLSDWEMNILYNQATIFVLPSIDDGFGMAVIEAMRAGLPVIITQNVGAAEILEERREGFIVPIRNVESLKERILFFYNNPDKVKEMGASALMKSREYCPQKYAERAMIEYERIIDRRKRVKTSQR